MERAKMIAAGFGFRSSATFESFKVQKIQIKFEVSKFQSLKAKSLIHILPIK